MPLRLNYFNMNSVIVYTLMLHLTVTLVAGTCTNSVQKRCESWSWAYNECVVSEAVTISDVTATSVDSGTDSCTKHGTFGWKDTTLWVDDGCRAEFTVCYETYHCDNSDTMLCESWGYERAECAISSSAVITQITVAAQHSAAACTLNSHYGWQGNILWVDQGCRADFSICYEDTEPCNDFVIQNCESWSWAYVECDISGAKKVTKASIQTLYGGTCNLNERFGWEDKKIWVNDGCRADFKVCIEPEEATVPCIETKEANCESWNWAYEVCIVGEAGSITSMTVKTQHSDSAGPCTLDESFGFFDNKLWVNDGCRADFTVCYNPGEGPCTSKVTQNCESWSWAYAECQISNAARVTSVTVSNVEGGDCTKGTDFGMFDDKIWVDNGCRANFDVCYEPPAAMGASTVTKHEWCYDDYPILDGLLCYEPCKPGYSHKGGGPLCWASCPSRTVNLGLFCTKKTYGRTAGNPLSTCSSAQDKDGLLCYPQCNNGYYGVGPVCWEYCKSGYTNDGALCRRNAHIYGRDVGNCPWHDKCGLCGGPWYNVCSKRRNCGGTCNDGYKNDGCTCRRDVHIYAKDTYGRTAGTAMGCDDGEEKDGALCYPKCDSGYNGVGPMCWATCSGETIDTGAQCQKKAYGRGVGKVINCLKLPTLDDLTNSSGLVSIMESADGVQILQGAACALMYYQAQFWFALAKTFNNCHKEDEWTTISISYAAGAAAGIEVSAEVGIAANIKLSKGVCFVGYCAGIKTDVSLAAEIVIGWWRSLGDIPGVSIVAEFGVDIPFTEFGISGCFATNTDGEYIATFITLGVGVGILPIEIGFSRCNTPEDSVIEFDI